MTSEPSTTQKRAALPPRLLGEIILLMLARLVVNVGRRFTYPFVPAISRDLNVPQTSVQSLIGLQAGIAVVSPALGPTIQRVGRKRTMLLMLLMMAIFTAFGAIWTQFGAFAVVMVGLGFGKITFDTAMLAYVGDRVPYERRGTAQGIGELSWAGAFVVSALIVGALLEAGTLRLVLAAMSGAFVVSAAAVFVFIPADHPGSGNHEAAPVPNFFAALRILSRHRAALAALGFCMAVAIANELIFINYGSFMESTFSLSLVALGAATTVIPLAEACGEFLVIGVADRLGKRRLALIGGVVSSLMYLILPHSGVSLGLAQIILFLMFFGTETSIVASIPLISEILPESRSIMFSAMLGVSALGRLAGSMLGGWLYGLTANFALLGALSMMIGLLACFLLWRYVPEHPSSAPKA